MIIKTRYIKVFTTNIPSWVDVNTYIKVFKLYHYNEYES